MPYHVQPRPASAGACAECATPLWGVSPGDKDKVQQLQPGCGLPAGRQAGRQRCSRPAVGCWPGSKRRGGCPARTRPQRLPSSCAGQEPGGKTSISASSSRAWAAGASTGTGGPCRILKLRQKRAAQRRISEWGGWGGAACTLAAVALLDWWSAASLAPSKDGGLHSHRNRWGRKHPSPAVLPAPHHVLVLTLHTSPCTSQPG